MFKWVSRLLGSQSAVAARRDNPVLAATVKKSAEIYDYLPLNQFIDREESDQLARQFYIEIDTVCNAHKPLSAIRDQLQNMTERLFHQERATNDLKQTLAELKDDSNTSKGKKSKKSS